MAPAREGSRRSESSTYGANRGASHHAFASPSAFSRARRPLLTIALIVVNLAVFVWAQGAPDQRLRTLRGQPVLVNGFTAVTAEYGFVPCELSSECRFGDNTAILYNDHHWTYRELLAAVNRMAGGLAHLGVRRGERVLLALPNCPEFVISFFAIQKLGAIVVNAAGRGTCRACGAIARAQAAEIRRLPAKHAIIVAPAEVPPRESPCAPKSPRPRSRRL